MHALPIDLPSISWCDRNEMIAIGLYSRRVTPLIRSQYAAAAHVRWASISGSDIRVGDLLEIDGGLWRVNVGQISRTAQGRAYMQCELRHLTEGTKKDVRFRSDDTVERADLDTPKKVQVLYNDGSSVHVMDQQSFDQSEIPLTALGDKAVYLQDGIFLHLECYKGTPALITFPMRLTFAATQLEESSGSAILENGMRVRVPKHLKAGDKVVLDTRTGEYVGKE